MDMPLNLIVLEQRGRERGSKGEKKGSVWAEAPSTVSFIWNNPATLPNWKLYQKIKKSSPSVLPLARSFSGTGEIAETACPPRHPVRLRDKHFLELGNKIVNFAVLNMLVLRVKWIWRAEEEEGGLFLSAVWGSVAHYTGLRSYNGCSLQGRWLWRITIYHGNAMTLCWPDFDSLFQVTPFSERERKNYVSCTAKQGLE